MISLKDYLKAKLTKRLIVPVLAGAMAISLGVYEFASPVRAASTAPAAAAAALDDSSVSALLALDQAMEHLAARVTPAVVNITVTSKHKQQFGHFDQREYPQPVRQPPTQERPVPGRFRQPQTRAIADLLRP